MENNDSTSSILIGDVIKGFRVMSNVSQAEMSKAIKISQPALQKIENNINTPRVQTIEKISEYFGMTFVQLMSFTEQETTPEKSKILYELFKKILNNYKKKEIAN